MKITINKGAGVNTVTVNGVKFDMNQLNTKQVNKFRVDLVKGLKSLGRV